MDDNNFWTLSAMEVYGGSFVRDLANAFRHADAVNTQILKNAFPKYWEEYRKMGKDMKERAEAEQKLK